MSASSQSSFFSSLKSGLSTAATLTKTAASTMAAKTQQTIAEMRAPPTEIQCTGCPLLIPVPPELFQQQTQQEQQSAGSVASTPHQPVVVCSTCQTATIVPSSNASKHLKQATSTAKSLAASAATATKNQINYLTSAPDTFHCAHCNALLGVPSGVWACQTCTAENAEDAVKCNKCGQKKSEQKAICGVCRQSTVIPSMNFIDGLKSTAKDVTNTTKKIYYDAAGKKYVTCSRCNSHCKLPDTVTPSPRSASISQSAANVSSEGQQAMQASSMINNEIVCTACKNAITPLQ